MEFEVNKLLPPHLYSDMLGLLKRLSLTPFNNKTVVITGAAQPLGMYLSCAFLINNDQNNAGTKVVAVDVNDRIFALYGKLTYRGDIDFCVSRDYSYLGCESADFVIHTQSFSELGMFDAAVNLFNFISEHNSRSVIAVGTDVYGEVYNGGAKISENDLYGYADCADADSFNTQAERMVQSLAVRLARDSGADIKLAILSQVYGSGIAKYYQIFRSVKERRSLTVDQSEKPTSVIYIADAAAALLTILLNGEKGEIYNVASDDALSPVILAEKCSEYIYGGELKVTYTGKRATLSYIDSNLGLFDNTKLKSLGFTPEFDLKSGIITTLNIMSEKGGES